VSAIIPARNEEATIARTVESVDAQPEVSEVIVVDDQSSDGTRSILNAMASHMPKLRILSTGELPAGWVGKNYAASIGAAAARCEWLLFTDADTYHFPGSARRALTDAVDHDAVLVSYSPEQEMKSFWERALIPFVYCRLAAKFSYSRINDRALPDAAANGQFLLMLRDAYRYVGGHRAVAGEIVEDVSLAQLVKQKGYGIYFTTPIGIVRTRMYRDFSSMWQGWTKNLYRLVGGTPRSVLREILNVAPLPEAMLFLTYLLILRRWHSGAAILVVIVAILLGRVLRYAADVHRNLFPLSSIQYYVPGMCLYTAALVASWWRNTRGSVVWKNRAYPARNL
jgi:glycosyltransferase involved in cell wall biosynthesis